MTFPFCSDVVITHIINLQVSFTSFLVHLILGLSASSLVTLQLQLICHICKPFPPWKPHILLCCSVSHMIIPTWKYSFCNTNSRNTYEFLILVYSCTGSMACACRNSLTSSGHHGRRPLFHPPSSLSPYCSLS